MIYILYDGARIPASDDGVPFDIPEYWRPPSTTLEEITQAFVDGQWEPIPDPEPPPPEPDWIGFKADYKSSPTIRAWFAGLDPMDREDLAAMVAAQSISGVTAAMADVNYGAVRDELNGLLTKHHIGLQLP